MMVIKDTLLKDFHGTPAGSEIQVLDKLHAQLVETGYFAEPKKKVPAELKDDLDEGCLGCGS